MKHKGLICLFVFCVIGLGWSLSWAAQPPQFPQDATFTTLQDAGNPGSSLLLPFPIEGLTGDDQGNLYTTGRAFAHSSNGTTSPNPPDPSPCPVWRIDIAPGSLSASFTQIGSIPNPTNGANPAAASCGPSGITFDSSRNIYVVDSQLGGVVWKLTRNSNGTYTSPASIADAFAINVPGTNGLAFDRDGNLWTGDGTTGQGRVWKIVGAGADCTLGSEINCVEVFRIQPMANEVNLNASSVGGVGRDVRTLPQGTITVTPTSRNAQNTASSQPLVANGIVIGHLGNMFVVDTARGALWKALFDRHGNLQSPTGCDTTFKDNTLCLSNVFVAHPILEGGDGIALDVAGNIWTDANERNAVAVVTKDGSVFEIFRNPVNATGLRNSADPSVGNNHILEFPTSPFISGTRFCTSQADGNRRDNSPSSIGEINAGAALASPDPGKRAKISCMTDPVTGNLIQLNIPGLPLPVH